jgi:hypothetical protein
VRASSVSNGACSAAGSWPPNATTALRHALAGKSSVVANVCEVVDDVGWEGFGGTATFAFFAGAGAAFSLACAELVASASTTSSMGSGGVDFGAPFVTN